MKLRLQDELAITTSSSLSYPLRGTASQCPSNSSPIYQPERADIYLFANVPNTGQGFKPVSEARNEPAGEP